MNDPFEAHAFFALEFNCDRCGATLQHSISADLFSTEYFRALAILARNQGWYSPEADEEGRMQVMFCLCPACVSFADEELQKTEWHAI